MNRLTRFAVRLNSPESRHFLLGRVYSAGSGSDPTRKVFAEDDVVSLTCKSSAEGGVCHVYVVGTFHCTQESCKRVEAIVSHLKPEVAFLELCWSRRGTLKLKDWNVPTFEEMRKTLKKTTNFEERLRIIQRWSISMVYKELELIPGGEFRVAYEEAKKYGGQVVLGDRPMDITLKRIWRTMPLWHKIKLITSTSLGSWSLHKLVSERDFATLKSVSLKMLKGFPTLEETLLNERDRYMSSRLLQTASTKSSVVAVVGLAHLPGIEKNWNQPISAKEVDDILQIPPKKKLLVSIQESLKKIFVKLIMK